MFSLIFSFIFRKGDLIYKYFNLFLKNIPQKIIQTVIFPRVVDKIYLKRNAIASLDDLELNLKLTKVIFQRKNWQEEYQIEITDFDEL